jgi:N-acetylneuraminic acid mutarotase
MKPHSGYYCKIGIITLLIISLYRFNSYAQEVWTSKAGMPTKRNLFSVCSLNGKLYAIGGCDNPSQPLSTVEVYDPQANNWISDSALPQACMNFASAVVNNKIYIFGG